MNVYLKFWKLLEIKIKIDAKPQKHQL